MKYLNEERYFTHGHMHTFKIVELYCELYDKAFVEIKENEEKLHKSIMKLTEAN